MEDDDKYVTVDGLSIRRLSPEELERKWARDAADELPIVAELNSAGLGVTSLGEMVNTVMDYRAQLPLIVDLVRRCDNLTIREMLVRALTIPAARRSEAPSALLAEFTQAPDDDSSSYRWVVGNALGTVATEREINTIVKYFTDPRYGTGRQELARAIARVRPPNALDVLVVGLDDEDVAGHCVEALGLLGDPAAIPHVERMTKHPKDWIAKAARTAIRRIEKRPRPSR